MSSRPDPLLPPLPERSQADDLTIPSVPMVPVRPLDRPLTRPLIDFDDLEARVVNLESPTTGVTTTAPLALAAHSPTAAHSSTAVTSPTSPLARPRAHRSREVAILVGGLGVCLAILLVVTLLVAQPFGSLSSRFSFVPGPSAAQLIVAATATATPVPTVTPVTSVTPSASPTPAATTTASPTGSPTAASTATPPTAAATFVAFDPATQGTWQGTYGNGGYLLAGDTQQQLPAAIQVTFSGATLTTWTGSTSDVRALVKPENPADRIAACWCASSSFTIDVTITDGHTSQVALYLLDWDQQQRAETISIVDPTSGAALDTRSDSSFGTGVYLVWQVSGHVTIQVTNGAGSPNAVVSALFLAPA